MSSLVTEGVNEVTKDIDVMNPEERVEALIEVDKEMFSGLGESLAQTVATFTERTYDVIRQGGLIIYQGAGTSGRFAKHSANEYESLLKGCFIFENGKMLRNFKGVIAGGYPALNRSIEGAEDDAAQGVQDVLTVLEEVQNALYVSISCSGGAKCNLGGLEAALMERKGGKQIDRVAILFNDIENLDDQQVIESIGKTTKEVYQGFEERDLIINPLLGPEAIAGSSRMKGGSMTQIILDIAFNAAVTSSLESRSETPYECVEKFLKGYAQCIGSLEAVQQQLAEVVEAATTSLMKGGSIYYIGSGDFGRLGITDASETVPTFGAPFGQVQGFTQGGWSGFLLVDELYEMDSKVVHDNPLGLEDFQKKELSENDLVILLGRQYPKMGVGHHLLKTFEHAKESGARTASLIIDGQEEGLGVYPKMPEEHYAFYQGYDKYVMKFLLNAISTAAYVGVGKTYENLMIDLNLTNEKLVDRAIERIINPITGHDKEFIEYHLNKVTNSAGKTQYGEVDHLIPTTLLVMAGLEYEEAVKKLQENPIIRNVISSHWSRNVVDFKNS